MSMKDNWLLRKSITATSIRFLRLLIKLALLAPFYRRLLSRLYQKIKSLEMQLGEQIVAFRKFKKSYCLSNNTPLIAAGDIIAFVRKVPEKPLDNEFFDYYRSLGVRHFIILACKTDEAKLLDLANQSDLSIWMAPSTQYEWLNQDGIYVLNALMMQFGVGHWCFILDSDEYFIYPKMDTRSLRELLAYLDQEGKTGFMAITLDMFGKEAIGSLVERPREECRWFDPDGLVQWWDAERKAWLIVGGARRRLLFNENPQSAPLINRIPLVKWQNGYFLTQQSGLMRPLKLNNPGFGDRIAPTGCLLQYRFCNATKAGILMELQARAHADDHWQDAQVACQKLSLEERLWHKEAVEYCGDWRQLTTLGLMNTGTWF